MTQVATVATFILEMNVGTKDLKNNLSRYLRLVRGGERVLVTDRGVAVAELRAVGSGRASDNEALRALESQGLVTRGRGKVRDFEPERPLKRAPRVSAMVIEDRD